MKLTGKCREDFEKWFMSSDVFNLNFLHLQNIQVFDRTKHFYKYPNSMQYGVYVDFFDSVDINITEIPHWEKGIKYFRIGLHILKGGFIDSLFIRPKENRFKFVEFTSRPQARNAAIEKANEIHNSKG